tara:strand:+ start:206 stop:952 length:747 start_codon:yes stop_codon:yes gene_type:complete
MAITVVSSASAAFDFGTTPQGDAPTTTIPATAVLADDYIFILFSMAKAQGIFTAGDPPTGFTEVCAFVSATGGSDRMSQVWYKKAVGGEEDDVFSFTTSLAGSAVQTGNIVLRGVDTASPFDVTATHATFHLQGQNDATPACAALTTVTDGAFVIAFTSLAGVTADVVSGYSSSRGGATVFVGVNENSGAALATYEEIASASTVGSDIHTYTDANAAADWTSMIFALRPSAAAAAAGGQLVMGRGLVG